MRSGAARLKALRLLDERFTHGAPGGPRLCSRVPLLFPSLMDSIPVYTTRDPAEEKAMQEALYYMAHPVSLDNYYSRQRQQLAGLRGSSFPEKPMGSGTGEAARKRA